MSDKSYTCVQCAALMIGPPDSRGIIECHVCGAANLVEGDDPDDYVEFGGSD